VACLARPDQTETTRPGHIRRGYLFGGTDTHTLCLALKRGAAYHGGSLPMNTRELATVSHWDEDELSELVTSFVRTFRRLPSLRELARFRQSRAAVYMRIPPRTQRPTTTLLVAM
jgi:hypothetical protein